MIAVLLFALFGLHPSEEVIIWLALIWIWDTSIALCIVLLLIVQWLILLLLDTLPEIFQLFKRLSYQILNLTCGASEVMNNHVHEDFGVFKTFLKFARLFLKVLESCIFLIDFVLLALKKELQFSYAELLRLGSFFWIFLWHLHKGLTLMELWFFDALVLFFKGIVTAWRRVFRVLREVFLNLWRLDDHLGKSIIFLVLSAQL